MIEQIGELSEREKILIRAHRQGHSILCHCDIGFMVTLQEGRDGRSKIDCPKQATHINGPAEAAHVRAVLKSWGAELRRYEAEWGEE